MLRQLHHHTILFEIAQGDERAFSSLFYTYHQPLGAFVFSVTRSPELTEEIIQDVFLKIWENRAGLPAIHNFTAWLFITTRNHTLNAIRQQTALKKKQAAANSYLEHQHEQMSDDHFTIMLDEAVEHLPQQQKKVYLLKQQGLKNADVAFHLNISVNSVKKYQQWALQSITRFLKAGPFILFAQFF